jgi:hypothetical protein
MISTSRYPLTKCNSMHGDSLHTCKETLSLIHFHQTHPYRPLQPHTARWVRWMFMVAMAPALCSCGQHKNSQTVKSWHRHVLPQVRKWTHRAQIPWAVIVVTVVIQIDALAVHHTILGIVTTVVATVHAPCGAYHRFIICAPLVASTVCALRLRFGY